MDRTGHEKTGSRRARSRTRLLLRAAASAVVLGLVLITQPASAATTVPNAWSGTYGDAGNSMNNPGEKVITPANAHALRGAWVSNTAGGSSWAPPATGGVLYRMVQEAGGYWYLLATSVRTGATLWTLHGLPIHLYWDALATTGHYVVVSYDSGYAHDTGGLLLIDTTTHKLVWSRPLPPSAISWMTNERAGVPYTDGTRIYVGGSSNWINTYRLSDGALLWTVPITNNSQGTPARFDGFAVAGGVVYSVGESGLVARNAATGHRLWTATNLWGPPVVAGSHVYALDYPRIGHTGVVAFPAGGCGQSTCAPSWARDVGADLQSPRLGGAGSDTLFVTYRNSSTGTAFVTRLAALTGKVQWTAPAGRYAGDLVRGGSTIWVFEEYLAAPNDTEYRIVGFSATATGTAPLRTIPMTDRTYYGFPQSLSIANGSLLQKINGMPLVAYRVPGT